MNRISCFLFRKLNRLVARLKGAEGWCAASYNFLRIGLPEDAIEPQGRIKAWWGSFMFKYIPLEEEDE